MVFERCRKTGLHVVRTRRLLIVSARAVDYWRHDELANDPEALYWNGSREQSVQPKLPTPLVAHQPIRDAAGVLFPLPRLLTFTAIDPSDYRIVGGMDIHRHGTEYRLGALMRQGYRGKGYGTEFLQVVIRLAHRHFGIGRVVAGHEDVNVASERWLDKAGFVATAGPQTYTLDNGRVVPALWREHTDEAAVLKCPWLTEAGQDRIRAMVPIAPREDDLAGQLNAALWQREQQATDDSCLRCQAPVK